MPVIVEPEYSTIDSNRAFFMARNVQVTIPLLNKSAIHHRSVRELNGEMKGTLRDGKWPREKV